MSSGSSSPDDILGASPGKTNFTRLARLLVCGGTRILRELFDHSYSPKALPIFLKTPATENHLTYLRCRRILSLSQWKVLYPTSSTCGESKSFDITLLVTLIREFCILTPPVTGWDNLPADHDLSLAADVARIKYYRNTVYAHGNETMELSDDKLDDYWSRLEGALIRIVKYYAGNTSSAVIKWEKAMTDLLTGPITDEFHINSIGTPQAELAMESRYFHNLEIRQSFSSRMEEFSDLLREIKHEKGYSEITVKCVLKSVSLGAVMAGTAYILFRYKDDPEELRRMIQQVILPVGGLVVVGNIAIGSIRIGLRAKSLDVLEELLMRYKSGKLQKDLEQIFMTKELEKATDGEVITFSVEMNENDYRIAYCEMLRASEGGKGKQKKSLRNRLRSVKTENNRLERRLNRWINCRRGVVKNLYNLAAKLKKLKARVNIAKARNIFDAFFWPVLVCGAGAALAYYIADGDWIMAAISTVLVAVVIVVVAVFGATAFKDSLRSFFLTVVYDFETRKRWPPGAGKNSASFIFPDPYDYVPRREVASELRASQTTRTRNEDVRELIMDRAVFREIIFSIQWEQEVIAEVHSSLGVLKGQVKCLAETETRSLASEHECGESSSAFDKPFQIEDILGSFTLPQPDIRAYVGSLMDNHQGNISKVVEKLEEMAENLDETCLKKDEAHDIVEKYLDELFIAQINDARIRSKKL